MKTEKTFAINLNKVFNIIIWAAIVTITIFAAVDVCNGDKVGAILDYVIVLVALQMMKKDGGK